MFVVVLLITIVGSILITWLLPMAIKSAPPYGLAVDVIAGTVTAIAWAWLAYEVLSPLIGLTGWLRLVGSSGDAIGFAAAMLWVLRRIKR